MFKVGDKDVMVEISQSEYDDMIEEINLLRELLAEANAAQPSKAEFKSVRDYTLEDWKQALDEEWLFECRGGDKITIQCVDTTDDRPIQCSKGWWYQCDGMWDDRTGIDPDDIMARIK